MSTPSPAFLIIGAQKAGTTSMHQVLTQHRSIWMPPIKELHYFDRESSCDEHFALDSYLAHYADAPVDAICGEATPCYLFHPDAARRIHTVLGDDIKLIITLRNPARRAYSHYLMNVRKGYETLGFEEALQAESDRIHQSERWRMRYSYIARGFYHEQLQRYLQHFKRSNLRIYIFEQDIIGDWPGVWSDLCQFLDLQSSPHIPLVQSNPARKIRSPLVHWAMKQPALKKLKNKLVSRDLNLKLRYALTESAAPMSSAQSQKILNQYFADDIQALQQLLGRPLDIWPDRTSSGSEIKHSQTSTRPAKTRT